MKMDLVYSASWCRLRSMRNGLLLGLPRCRFLMSYSFTKQVLAQLDFIEVSWRFPHHHHHSGPFAEEQCDRWKHLQTFVSVPVDSNIAPVTVLPSSMTMQSNFEDVGPSFRLTKGRSLRKWRHCTLLHSVDVLERSSLKAVVAIETAVSEIDLFISSTGNFNIITWVHLKVWAAL